MERPVTAHPADETLVSYGLGKLDETIADVVDRHLAQCPPCRERVAELSSDSFVNRLRGVRSPVPDVAASVNILPTPAYEAAADEPKSPTAAASPHQLPPDLVDHPQYHIERELGRGGIGVVYLARNKLMNRLEALKILNKDVLERRGMVDRFIREIQSAARLSHQNVVTAHSAHQTGNLLIFAMEYVDGDDLSRLVKKRGPLPIVNACYFTMQAAQGLQHAHERGMTHRDIKPQNLILAREGKRAVVKILDFGLVKVTNEGDLQLTHEGQMLGTPDYIAPEQTLDAQKADIRSDIYSLGCTLHYLLTGRPPFQGPSLYAVLQAHQSTEPKPVNLVRPEVPVELAAVVGKMMAKDPARRYQTPAEVVQALKPFVKPGSRLFASLEAEISTSGQTATERASEGNQFQASRKPRETLTSVPAIAAPRSVAANQWESLVDFGGLDCSSHAIDTAPPKRRQAWQLWIGPSIVAGLLLLGLLAAWGAGVFRVATKEGVIVLENLPPQAEVMVDGEQITVKRIDDKSGEITVRAGERYVEVKSRDVTVAGERVTIASGERKPISIHLERPTPRDEAGNSRQQTTAVPAADAVAKTHEPELSQDQAIRIITQLGGKFEYDLNRTDKPVINVDLSHSSVNDEGLKAVAKLKSIENLNLHDCRRITDNGLLSIKDLKNLKELELWNVPITDNGLEHFASLTRLERLNLAWIPGITDKGIESIRQFTNLRSLDLSGAHISDSGIERLESLQQLRELLIRATPITDAAVKTLAGFSQLESLEISQTNVTDASMILLPRLTNLTSLAVSGPKIAGRGYDYLDQMPKVKSLAIHGAFQPSIWKHVGQLKNIENLNVFESDFDDAALAQITGMQSLKFLEAGSSRVTDAGLKHLLEFPNLANFNIGGKGVTAAARDATLKELAKRRDANSTAIGGVAVAADTVLWTALFNGKDLTGWTDTLTNGSTWQIKDGIVEGSGGKRLGNRALLVSNRNNFANFKLAFQALRSGSKGKRITIRQTNRGRSESGYAISLGGDSDESDVQPGSITKITNSAGGGGKLSWEMTVKDAKLPTNEWFKVEVTAIGNVVTTSINGHEVAQYVDKNNSYPSGAISLSCQFKGTIEIKEMVLQELPDSPQTP